MKRAHHLAFAEGKHFTSRLLGDQPSGAATAAIRLLVTAFLLLHLDGQDQLADEPGKVARTSLVDLAATSA